MELLQLKYFKTVAEIGKISAAAEQLFISAPALSTSISRLEKELGMPLFTRTNNRIFLNAQGQILLQYANRVLDDLDTAKEKLRQSLLPQNSHISIFSVNTIMWTDFIAAFSGEYPHIDLSWTAISPASLAERGLPSQCTFLFAAENEIPKSFEKELNSIQLLENRPMVMINTSHPLAKEPIISVDMLVQETIFMPTAEHSFHQRIDRLFEDRKLPLPVHTSHTFLVRQQMVSKNLGISFASKYARYTIHPNITYVPLEDPYGPWINRMYWRKKHTLTETESCLCDFAKAYCKNLH